MKMVQGQKEGTVMGTGMRRICGVAVVLVLVCVAIHVVCGIAERPAVVSEREAASGGTLVERTTGSRRVSEAAPRTAENGAFEVSKEWGNSNGDTSRSENASPAAPAGTKAAFMADGTELEPHAASRVLEERQTPPDPDGRSHRVRIVKTTGKYPLVRVDETRVLDPVTHEQKTVRTVEMAADHIVITLNEGATEDDLRALNAAHGARILRKLRTAGPGTYLVKLPAGEGPAAGPAAPVENLVDAVPLASAAYAKAVNLVSAAEPDYLVRIVQNLPDDPGLDNCWGLHNTGQTGGIPDADIDAPEAWDRTTGDANVLVGIIDTGIDYNHPDLTPNIWNNPGETGTDAQGADKR
ncbi:hypothetical protein ACFL01_02030, partial [Planctomycetota bacterium]